MLADRKLLEIKLLLRALENEIAGVSRVRLVAGSWPEGWVGIDPYRCGDRDNMKITGKALELAIRVRFFLETTDA